MERVDAGLDLRVADYLAEVLGQSQEDVMEMMEVSSNDIDFNSWGNFLLISDIIA
jgi:hypothetical protein